MSFILSVIRPLSAVVLALASAALLAQSAPTRIDGQIVSVEGAILRVRAASGEVVAISVADKARVQRRVPTQLDQLKPGMFLGATAAPQGDGTLVASEVHIFPEALRGTGEGHRPFANDNRSTMTNATVKDARTTHTMTNATVSGVASAPGSRRLTLAYQGGEKTIVVPANVPVVTTEVADVSALKAGEHVIVTVTGAPGAYSTDRISVGVNGSVPPI
ncbi:MAG: hypothetical protein M3Z31_00505 [Pseudomonadota bacterium]|nr:hypothetical protein [Pseudomonadota bacterium]